MDAALPRALAEPAALAAASLLALAEAEAEDCAELTEEA